jgi:hypothetical protein
MKRLVLMFVPVAVCVLAVSASMASGGAVVTIGSSSCAVVDSNLNCVPGPFQDVQTSNAKGVEIERATANGVFNDTGHAIVFTFAAFPQLGRCGSDVTGAVTTDWVETLSAGGQATIVCRFGS